METSLKHLPIPKQEELQLIVETICKSKLRPEMIILFGSYSRGDWVEDVYQEDGITYEYRSDFDLLIVAETAEQVNFRTPWRKLEKSFLQSSKIQTPVSLIGIDIQALNVNLSKGQYFFTDIQNEGILLYDSEKFILEETRELSSLDRRSEAIKYYKLWFSKAAKFQKIFKFCQSEKDYNEAAFILHQVVEYLFTTTLLVFTNHRPKLHDLKELEAMADSQYTGIGAMFPKSTEDQKRIFELLRTAYTEARYNENYRITKEELEWLGERVEKLQDMTERICKEKIESFVK